MVMGRMTIGRTVMGRTVMGRTEVARALAATAVTDVACRWQLVLVGRAGTALAVTTVPRTWLAGLRRADPGPSVVARVTLTLPIGALDAPDGATGPAGVTRPDGDRQGWICQPGLRPVLVAAFRAGHRAARRLRDGRVPGGRVPGGQVPGGVPAACAGPQADSRGAAGPCSHQDAVAAYRVPGWMRALVETRDQTCRFPSCRQPAWRCDQDHTLAYERGGPTCPCNLGPLCRHHHRCKQSEGWQLEQPEPGVLVWRTPARRTYTTTPAEYPV